MWLWGGLTKLFFKLHIAREVRRHSERYGASREEAREAVTNAMLRHFDAAWPTR